MSSSRDALVYVDDMLARVRRIIAKTEGVTWDQFRDDEDLHDIAERCISVLGEAACKVSVDFRAAHPEVPWVEVIGIRHKVVHDYFEVNYRVLWSVIRYDLPPLERVLAALLDAVERRDITMPESPNDPAPVADLAGDLSRLRALAGIKWSRYPTDVLPCWVADMDFPTAPPVIDALRGLVDRADFGYEFHAQHELPRAWAAWQAERHGWRPDTSHARVLDDVLQAVDLALYLGTKPGDGVVLFTPVYPPFFRCVTGIGRRIVDCPLEPGTWRLDPERLEACIDPGTHAILTCNPHNPTGRVFTRDELAAIAGVAERHNLLVISDEIWADVVYSGAWHIPFASLSEDAAARTVTAMSASKAFNLAGLRCAVAHIGDERLFAKMAELPDHLLGGVSSPGATASLAAWTEGGEWLAETVAYLEANRDHLMVRLAAELPGVGATSSEATYLAWLDMRAYDLGDDPAAWLLEHAKVALNAGPDFGEQGAGFARINFATTRAVLDEAIDRIAGALGR